jgi:NDP-sugar pyrophosphorylase family protein
MNVIITLAGHSRRFKAAGYTVPKFLIEIDGKTMLEHVMDMFSPRDSFYFIANQEQVREYPELEQIINKNLKKAKLIAIDSHEMGPTYSILQANESLPKDEPVIISYCDFFVEWDYRDFLAQIPGYQAAVPCFKGFQPSSFGHTKYAYIRQNAQAEMLELREKESFTDNRIEEYASAGIYYFESYQLFQDCAAQLMQDGFGNLTESYVSLLTNIVIERGGNVKITKVEKFICWGTPEDLSMYQFWSEYFLKNSKKPVHHIGEKEESGMVNLMPMAGKGSRFKKEKYNVIKPLIHMEGEPMFLKACQSFPASSKWVFLFRNDVLERNALLSKLIKAKFAGPHIVPVKEHTSGQAATCLLGKEHIEQDKPLYIASCDYLVYYDEAKWNKLSNGDADVLIWTYKLDSMLAKDMNAFAYCKVGEDGLTVTEVVEKATISDEPKNDHLVIGSFWFKHGKDFVDAAEYAIDKDINVNGEHYVGNSLNTLIEQGKKVKVFEVDQWVSVGDPFELDLYFWWEDFFYKRY